MKAMQLFELSGRSELRPAEMAHPHAGPGEVLVRVCAAGVTRTELGPVPDNTPEEWRGAGGSGTWT